MLVSMPPAESAPLIDGHPATEEQPFDMDCSIFQDLLGGAFARRKKETVGNSTELCHLDGGSNGSHCEDQPGRSRAREISNTEKGGSLNGERQRSREEKTKNNQLLAVHMAPAEEKSAAVMFATYQAAGLPREELKRLVRVLHNSAIAGETRVSVAMSLRELGEIRFDVRIVDKKVYINATVESSRAATAMALAISDLKGMLEDCGLTLAQFDVTTGVAKQQQRRADGNRGTGRDTRDEKRGAGRQSKKAPVPIIEEDGTLHVLA